MNVKVRRIVRYVGLGLAIGLTVLAASDYFRFLLSTSLPHMANGGDFEEIWHAAHTFIALPAGYRVAPTGQLDLLNTAAYPNYPPTMYLLFQPLATAPLGKAATVFFAVLQACVVLALVLVY